MPIQVMNPPGLAKPEHYAHVSVATGTRTVFLAGQVAQDAEGRLVGVGDLAAQAERAMLNVATALEAAGAGFDDVAKMTIYVANWRPERTGELVAGLGRAAARLEIAAPRPTTVVGVSMLAHPDILVELDVIAVLA